MNRELQLKLAGMTLEEFRAWHEEGKNADLLPMFMNARWLETFPDPIEIVWGCVKTWAVKHPYPTPEQLAELQAKNLWKQRG